ncbi:MAG: hypothetical protein CL946_01110 [Ectothiorhodospiraceae bacterium]|nr:hypothetical protein [Ectothiorhodospiraceae bacterium]
MKKQTFFVYGLLKKGHSKHNMLQAEGGARATAQGVVMYNGPGIPFAAEGTGSISGEVYEIDEERIPELDAFEECPDLYIRKRIEVELEDGSSKQAWIYLSADAPNYPIIEDGVWRQEYETDTH